MDLTEEATGSWRTLNSEKAGNLYSSPYIQSGWCNPQGWDG
jgi:hypothetical protein